LRTRYGLVCCYVAASASDLGSLPSRPTNSNREPSCFAISMHAPFSMVLTSSADHSLTQTDGRVIIHRQHTQFVSFLAHPCRSSRDFLATYLLPLTCRTLVLHPTLGWLAGCKWSRCSPHVGRISNATSTTVLGHRESDGLRERERAEDLTS
jgi:hypothetical protein